MTTADAVIASLRAMPRSEVDAVRKKITAFMAFGEWGGEAKHVNINGDASAEGKRVFRVVADEMRAAGLADAREQSYWKLSQRANFDGKAERLVAFLAEQHHDRRVQDGILRIGVQLLIKFFQRFAETQDTFIITTAIIARNVHKVPARLDREFPGYAACNMLHLLIPHA
jgi:hypothetical protein